MRHRLLSISLAFYLLYLPCKFFAQNYLEAQYPAPRKVSVGQNIPTLELKDLEGNKKSLADSFAQGHVVVLNFWATWCAACQQELPALNAFYEKYHNRGLDLFAVSVDVDASIVHAWMFTNPINAPVMLDKDSSAMQALGLSTLPSTVVIDRKGRVLAVRNSIDQVEDEVAQWLLQ